MDKLRLRGGEPLRGSVRVNGSKNASLPIIAAALLTDEPVVIRDVAFLRDIMTMLDIVRTLGVEARYDRETRSVFLHTQSLTNCTAPYDLVRRMRASICVLGPLLARRHRAMVSMPGGCVIGPRPIDLHLKGLRALGAEISVSHGYINANARRCGLKGTEIHLAGPFGSSVLASANVLMAAVLAEGRTVIRQAACEPEVVDLANFLIVMGARIQGHGSSVITVEGVTSLHGTDYTIIPDRIEAGTFLLAGLITKGDIVIENVDAGHLGSLLEIVHRMGGVVTPCDELSLRVQGQGRVRAVDVTTMPYPGFPTDLQAQLMAVLTIAQGDSVVTEKIYPDRFIHVSELCRMGAAISVEVGRVVVKGVSGLSGANVMASDLRASAGLVLAGLVADGETEIARVYHIDRGYEKIEERLTTLGAVIERTPSKETAHV